jgi:hypothetical protein
VKRSGRDEPIWVVIHICMETTQGVSLYSYLISNSKDAAFSSTKSKNKKAEQVLSRSEGVGRAGQIPYTHVSNCKNDKIKILNI